MASQYLNITTPHPNEASIPTANSDYDRLKSEFVADVRGQFGQLKTEIAERNDKVSARDDYVYGDRLSRSLDIPIGHDSTTVNWLRRTVEIHKNMFMGRGFQVISTYDSKDIASADDADTGRIQIENDKQKEYAEARMMLIRSIIQDNGGDTFWSNLAENASTVGDSAVKAFWDDEADKYVLSEIESIENLYALWAKDDFRKVDAYGYVYQVSKQEAIANYGAPDDVTTSPLGAPFEALSATGVGGNSSSSQPMVTVLEVTGKLEGWASDNGRCKRVNIGKETEFNALIVGNYLTRLIDDPKRIPKYYLLPNKRQRRRPWGLSDITDAAININLTYIETLSDWRTASSKINFNKYKAFGFGMDAQIPKPQPRAIEYLPLSEGQDLVELGQSRVDGIDWGRQLDELKEQFVRETGLSRVLFDDPSVTLNSNQALLTSMKPTSDIAEAKKQLWAPVLRQIFQDALETIALNKTEIAEIVSEEDNWTLKIMWPSIMQKEDPVYQNMLLNRFNAGTMSLQSYLEAQGDSKEEVDRIKDELTDPITAAILGKQLPLIAQTMINAATAQLQAWYMASLPQPPDKSSGANSPGINSNGGAAMTAPIDGPANNVAGPVSQPGSGATPTSPQGALNQVVQANGG